jgi:HD-GYP domain-containing protein (c-di-GMP phosphodiesterase class II)
VLSALIDLSGMWATVTHQYNTGHAIWALDPSGQVFATTNALERAAGRSASDSPLVQRFLSAEGRATETMPFEERGVRYLGSYAATGQGWGVFVSAREQQAYLPVTVMIEGTITWAGAALALAAFAAIVFARTLSNPINKLAAASGAFARGEFATRVRIRQRNEIGELAFTFNTMADEIETRMRQLKRAAEENNELFLGTIRALAQAIDAKDPYTRGHSERVNRYSVILARELGLSDSEVRDIHVSSLLHDVGKIGIHDAVLNKPGKLTPEEFELMKTHTVLGAQIMGQIPQMERIIPGLRWHHERWQGGGYPDGLTGERIPLMARIIAVADTFDAVTTTRPYQKTMTVPEALEVLNRLKGVALNETVVEAFFRAFHAGKIQLDRPTAPPVPAPPGPSRRTAPDVSPAASSRA